MSISPEVYWGLFWMKYPKHWTGTMSSLYSEGVGQVHNSLNLQSATSQHALVMLVGYSLPVAFFTLFNEIFLRNGTIRTLCRQDSNALLLEYYDLMCLEQLGHGSNNFLDFMKKYSKTKAGMSSTWPWTSVLAHFDRQLSDHFLILHIVMFVSPDIQSSHNGSLWVVCCRLRALLIRRCWKLLIAIALSEILHISVLTNEHRETPLWMSHCVHKCTPLGSDVLCIVLLKDYKEMLHILVDQNIPDGCSASTAQYWTDAKPWHKTRACEPWLSLGAVIL